MVRVGSGFQANNRCGWHPTVAARRLQWLLPLQAAAGRAGRLVAQACASAQLSSTTNETAAKLTRRQCRQCH